MPFDFILCLEFYFYSDACANQFSIDLFSYRTFVVFSGISIDAAPCNAPTICDNLAHLVTPIALNGL